MTPRMRMMGFLLCGLALVPAMTGRSANGQAMTVQRRGAARAAGGTVTGHVFCADTQRPARLAKVALVSVGTALAPLPKGLGDDGDASGSLAGEYVETTLDGSFRIANVKPGDYYLIVDKEGYTLPLGEFTKKQLNASDPETRQRLERDLKTVHVGGEQTVNTDVTIQRGAAINGTATYDDGSPAGGLQVEVLSKGEDGKWKSGIASRYRSTFGREVTDDYGHYRIGGLPPGEYVVEVAMTLSEYTTTTTPGAEPGQMSVMRMQMTKYSLPLYSGNQLRKSNAAPIEVGAGEERTGADLTFPLSKLHRVTGQVVAKDGHTMNAGKASLVWADDGSPVTEADIEFADNQFHLEFVPEGEFKLKVSGAKLVTKVEEANAPGSTPKTHEETKTLRTYGDAEQALVVQSETSGVVVTVPESAKTTASAP